MATQYALTDLCELKMLSHVFNDPSRTFYLALYTVAPSETSPGEEVPAEATGYSRQEIVFSTPYVPEGSTATVVSNTNTVSFGPALSNWGIIEGGAIFDDMGQMLVYGVLTHPQAITEGNKIEFGPGAVEIGLD